MKLKRVTTNDPVERVALSLHQSLTSNLAAYREFYKQTYGDEISLSQLVEEMAKSFMTEDKAFQKYMGNESEKAARKQRATPPAGEPAGTDPEPLA